MTKSLFYRIYLLSLTCIGLAGCATGYSSDNLTGGYMDTQLAPDVFRVKFDGNGFTTAEKAQEFALLRAADLTLANGYGFFGVLHESNDMRQETYNSTPSSVSTYGSYSNGSYASTTYYNPATRTDIYKPEAGLLIQCFHSKPGGFFTYDAAFLENSLRAKYHLPPAAPLPAPYYSSQPSNPQPVAQPPPPQQAAPTESTGLPAPQPPTE